MIGLAHVLAFIAGGTIGFILASIVACARLNYLTGENQSLKKDLAHYQRAVEVALEQSQVSNTSPSANRTSPLTELVTGTEG